MPCTRFARAAADILQETFMFSIARYLVAAAMIAFAAPMPKMPMSRAEFHDAMRSLLFTHLDQTLAEATHRLQGDYAADAKDYDAIEKHALMMADALSDGIMKQFPSKFSGARKMASR